MDPATLTALRLSFLYASLAMLLILIPGTVLGYVLARRRFFGKRLLSSLVVLPMVLPPTGVGYLLLRMLATDGPLGPSMLGFDPEILLTGKAVVLAGALMAIPLFIRTARVTFEGVDPRFETMARTLGYGRFRTFFAITLPLAGRGLLAALILAFTRALGEFGATVTIAGNIPGRTQTLSAAIYSAQQVGNEREAWFLLLVSLVTGLVAIMAAEWLADARPASLLARRSS